MKKQETKAYGSIRKIKSYGACGVILGLAALMLSTGVVAHADETAVNTAPETSVTAETLDATTVETKPEVTVTTTANPATNLEEAQSAQSAEHAEIAKKSETASGELTEAVTSESLNKSVDEAKEAGVAVKQEAPVAHESLEQANADLEKQKQAVEEATQKQVENTEAIKSAQEQNAQIEKDNAAEKERVAKENDEKKASVEQANQAKKEVYEAQLKDFEAKQAELEEARRRNQAHAVVAPSKVALQMEGRETQRDYNVTISSGKYDAKFTLDNATGKFTINTILDDGNKPLLGDTYIDGRIHYATTYNGDTDQTTTVVTGITYEQVRYVSHRKNQAVDQNIAITYYDPSGKTIFTRKHDGNTSWTEILNKTYQFNKDIILKPNQTSDFFDVLRLFDDWVLDSRSVIRARFVNNNEIVPPVPNNIPIEPPAVEYEAFKPIEPKLKPLVEIPEKQQFDVAVHPVFVKQTPVNIKSVSNTDDEDTNGKLVPKGSIQTWTLTNSSLKAGRPVVTNFTMNDPFPSGFKLDVDATNAKNSAWTLSVGENGKLQLVATEETLALLNANRDEDVAIPLAYLVGSPQNDGATYENTFDTVITTPEGQYTVVSNTPVIYTPGNDPETPRETPEGENPTPDDNLIQPKKDVVDDKGNSINGKSVLPDTTLNYVAEQDFDQYKGMSASKDSIAKGFLYVDDYLDHALDGKSMVVHSITAQNGDDVRNLLDMYHVLSKESLSEELQKLIADSGISPVGEFYLWVAKDPQAFYEAYVQKGLDITYNLSFNIKKEFTEGDITNQTFQVDFANGYYGNIVKNKVPKLEAKKDVFINMNDTESKDGKEIQLGEKFFYYFEGSTLPGNRGENLFDYSFVDNYDEKGDKFTGEFHVRALVDIKLKDGTVIKAGQEVTEFVNIDHNVKDGILTLSAKENFLGNVSDDSEFGLAAFVQMERIASGTFENTLKHYVNNVEVMSNTVKTTTPEPEKPQPAEPAKPVLPKTGEKASKALSVAGAGMLIASSLAGLASRRKEEQE